MLNTVIFFCLLELANFGAFKLINWLSGRLGQGTASKCAIIGVCIVTLPFAFLFWTMAVEMGETYYFYMICFYFIFAILAFSQVAETNQN